MYTIIYVKNKIYQTHKESTSTTGTEGYHMQPKDKCSRSARDRNYWNVIRVKMRIPSYTSLSRSLDKQSSQNFNVTSESYFPYETSLRVFYVVILNLFHVYKERITVFNPSTP